MANGICCKWPAAWSDDWFLQSQKIQLNGFRWKIFRNEAIFTIINFSIACKLLGFIRNKLTEHGFITYKPAPASGWVIALEYMVYFLGFDTWLYWFHRWMHKGLFYNWVHKLHHRSTSPNLLTTASVTPLESLINGEWTPVLLSEITVHTETLKFILPTSVIMGLYVHSGYGLFPRWWHKLWAAKWVITGTFMITTTSTSS